jgi:hypothetical protein
VDACPLDPLVPEEPLAPELLAPELLAPELLAPLEVCPLVPEVPEEVAAGTPNSTGLVVAGLAPGSAARADAVPATVIMAVASAAATTVFLVLSMCRSFTDTVAVNRPKQTSAQGISPRHPLMPDARMQTKIGWPIVIAGRVGAVDREWQRE